MRKTRIQINSEEYNQLDYLDKPRWISLWHQIDEVAKTSPKTILEIGVGNGLATFVLRKLYKVTTFDFDPSVKPDYIGDVRSLPFRKNQFDTILCAQVLEHIPFSDFTHTLQELHRVTRKSVIISLPHDYLTYILLTIKLIPYIKPWTFFYVINRSQTHLFNGQHYWEIGKKGYRLERIVNEIKKVGFIIEKTYALPENPYHQFFVLSKREAS